MTAKGPDFVSSACHLCPSCVTRAIIQATFEDPQGGTERAVEAFGDLSIELGEEVPVAVEGDLHAGMSHTDLDGLRVGSLGDGHGHSRVPEVMEADTFDTGAFLGRLPVGAVEARRVDGVAGTVREHHAIGSRSGSLVELCGEEIRQEARQGDATAPGRGLGRLAHPAAVEDHELLDDRDSGSRQIDASTAEADQLPPAHPRVGGRVDEGPELRRQLLGHPLDLLGVEETHFGGIDPGAAETHARRASQ